MKSLKPWEEKIPRVVRVYGPISIGIQLMITLLVGVLALPGIMVDETKENLFCLLSFILFLAVIAFFYRIGVGLRKGEKSAVYGVCIIFVSEFIPTLLVALYGKGAVCSFIPLGLVALLNIPILVAAFRNWDCLY